LCNILVKIQENECYSPGGGLLRCVYCSGVDCIRVHFWGNSKTNELFHSHDQEFHSLILSGIIIQEFCTISPIKKIGDVAEIITLKRNGFENVYFKSDCKNTTNDVGDIIISNT